MSWKPKTVAGKLLKGAVIGGGSLLALATGNRVITNIVSRATTPGTAELASKTGSSVVGLAGYVDQFKEGAANLITGKTKEIRQTINRAKADAKTALMKTKAAEQLISLGKDPADARSAVGLEPYELEEVDGKPIEAGLMSNKMLMFAALAFGAIFLLPKILKR